MIVQLSNGLQLLLDQFVRPPSLFILPGFPHGPFFLTLNPLLLLILLVVDKFSKIGNSLLNRVHVSKEMMEVITHTHLSFSKTRNLHSESKEGLEEGGIKQHVR